MGETASAALLAFRKKHSLNQQELADLLGVSSNTVARWERQEQSPPGQLVELALLALDKSRKKRSKAPRDFKKDLAPLLSEFGDAFPEITRHRK